MPTAATKERVWSAATTDLTLSNDHLDAMIGGFKAGVDATLIEGYAANYFASLRTWWAGRSIEIARRLVNGLFPASDELTAVDQWLDANADAPASLRRLVLEKRDNLARDLRVQAFNSAL